MYSALGYLYNEWHNNALYIEQVHCHALYKRIFYHQLILSVHGIDLHLEYSVTHSISFWELWTSAVLDLWYLQDCGGRADGLCVRFGLCGVFFAFANQRPNIAGSWQSDGPWQLSSCWSSVSTHLSSLILSPYTGRCESSRPGIGITHLCEGFQGSVATSPKRLELTATY